MMKTALTIAGFDPSGGAGIQADLKVFHLHRTYGISVAAAITAQSSTGVSGIVPIQARFVKEQLRVLLADLTPDATKIGMLYTGANVRAVANTIMKKGLRNIVIDPVVFSSSGKRLAHREAVEELKRCLIPLSTVITPNLYEAGFLSGVRIRDVDDMKAAAERLSELGAGNVIITGGHMKANAIDLLYNGSFHEFRDRKRAGQFHGTGCIYSAAITSYLAEGKSVLKAAELAKVFMGKAFTSTFSTGKGMRLFGI